MESAEVQIGAKLSLVSTYTPKLGGETAPPSAAQGSGGEEDSSGETGR